MRLSALVALLALSIKAAPAAPLFIHDAVRRGDIVPGEIAPGATLDPNSDINSEQPQALDTGAGFSNVELSQLSVVNDGVNVRRQADSADPLESDGAAEEYNAATAASAPSDSAAASGSRSNATVASVFGSTPTPPALPSSAFGSNLSNPVNEASTPAAPLSKVSATLGAGACGFDPSVGDQRHRHPPSAGISAAHPSATRPSASSGADRPVNSSATDQAVDDSEFNEAYGSSEPEDATDSSESGDATGDQ